MSTFLRAHWQNLIMVNYQIEPKYLKPYLPSGVEFDLYQGKCFVSLVGFMFKNVRIFNIPIPFFGNFEEVNLRFYVTRKNGNQIKRGVVFINETVPNKIVAYIANKLYKEHYTTIPTKHQWKFESESKFIEYQWKVKHSWSSMKIKASTKKEKMLEGSFEEFIFEHYYGYTKISENKTLEYKIAHPRWEINPVNEYKIDCDFSKFYGPSFSILNASRPSSVMLAEGSEVSVNWKRNEL
jgi:uncharacterized protein YqjF (DUF2071 family)